MSVPSHKTHLGFAVHIDELVEEHALTMRSATHVALEKTQAAVDWTIADIKGKLKDATDKLAQAEIKIAGLSKPAKEEKA